MLLFHFQELFRGIVRDEILAQRQGGGNDQLNDQQKLQNALEINIKDSLRRSSVGASALLKNKLTKNVEDKLSEAIKSKFPKTDT
jgi:hypothetical protein